MFTDFEYTPLLEDFYGNGDMRLESIVKIMENSGSIQSDAAGDNLLEDSRQGIAWVLTDWYVKMDSYPKYGDKILAKTWTLGITSIFGSIRNFEFYANGKLIGRGATNFILYDLNTKKPCKLTQERMAGYEPEDKLVFEDKKFPRIAIPESFSTQIKLKSRRNDIDYNNHVHNLTYIDYAMEAIPENIYKNHDFKNIRIMYKAPVAEGEEITVKYAFVENQHIVCIYGAENSLKTLISLW